MHFRIVTAATGFALIASLSAPVSAAEKNEFDIGTFSANVGLFSDYTYRGVSQTGQEPALQGGMDWEHDIGLYAGVWGSNVDFSDGNEAHVEVDVYAGYGGSVGNFSYDLNFLYYLYPGASDALNYDFWEITPQIGYDFGVASVALSVSYSPDFFGGSDAAQFYQASVEVPLPKGFTLSGNVGYQAVDDNATFALPDYLTWGVGLGFDLGTLHSKLSNFSIGVDYVDTDISAAECGSENCDARAVLNISASF
jgi:uncharacterized protein (TIGR02001 family)